MKKILVAYADENMQYSSKLLAFQAKLLHVFDDVILYNPNNLPEYIKKSPLMKYKKGGGYWAWKPCVIWETLQKYADGDIICYIDSGCRLHSGILWKILFKKMLSYDTICFQYSDKIPSWTKFGTSCSKIKYWTKKKTLLFFDDFLKSKQYRDFDKIMGGVIFCKGRNNQFVKNWLDITIKFPELIIDPNQDELLDQYDFFSGYHRHDQSIITPLAYLYKDTDLCVLPEKYDEADRNNIIVASRLRVTNRKDYMILRKYMFFHVWENEVWFKYIKCMKRKLLNIRHLVWFCF